MLQLVRDFAVLLLGGLLGSRSCGEPRLARGGGFLLGRPTGFGEDPAVATIRLPIDRQAGVGPLPLRAEFGGLGFQFLEREPLDDLAVVEPDAAAILFVEQIARYRTAGGLIGGVPGGEPANGGSRGDAVVGERLRRTAQALIVVTVTDGASSHPDDAYDRERP